MADLRSLGPQGLNTLTAAAAARKLEAGEINAERLVRDCLARIEAREPVVQAWDYLDPKSAIEQAQALDASPRRSPLHGIPIGIKDIFDTKDMPTGHGFPPYQGLESGVDSKCVAQVRAAGLLIIGKTLTTEFACSQPRQTTNPHDPKRTPGVSSSGSAAAVADFMIPLANGSQTGGSVVGPAANCGVYGYKASLDGIDRGGFRHCKPSIDTIGLFARSLEDLILLRHVQTGANKHSPVGEASLRIGIVRTNQWRDVEPATETAMAHAIDGIERAGADVVDVDLPSLFTEIVPDFSIVNGWEATLALKDELRDHLEAFNAHNRERAEFVRGLTVEDYNGARQRLNNARREMATLISDYDAFISPSLLGEAPIGLAEVRTANFARLWTQMYTPVVNIPVCDGPNGLPVSIQVIGPQHSDDRTLAIAHWVDTAIDRDSA